MASRSVRIDVLRSVHGSNDLGLIQSHNAAPSGRGIFLRIVTEFPRKIVEIENCWIPMSDGCRLAARIWLPEDAETHRVPAVLEYLPCRKRDFLRARDEPIHSYF